MTMTSGSSRGSSLFPSGRGYGYGAVQRRHRGPSGSESDESVRSHGQYSPPECTPGKDFSPSGDPGESRGAETSEKTVEETAIFGTDEPGGDKHAAPAGLEPSDAEITVEATTFDRPPADGSAPHEQLENTDVAAREGKVPAVPGTGQAGHDRGGTGAPDEDGASKTPYVTLGMAIQAEISQAILDGTIEDFIDKTRGFIQSISRFLESTDAGAEVIGNLVRRVREELQREIEVEPQAVGGSAGEEGATGSGSVFGAGATPGFPGAKAAGFDPAILRLMWSLFKTSEFQQFTAKMIAQSLKAGLKQPL